MTIYQEKLPALANRTVAFSVLIIKTCGPLASNPALRSITDQIIRSATSIGANYAEANNSSSNMDFKNNIYIAKKEAGETIYWPKVLAEVSPSTAFSKLQQEALELNLILQKITTTLKSTKAK